MNVLFFLTPKSKIKCVNETMTIRQVLEIFEHYRYQVLPIISKDGKYIRSISEGDLLYYLKNNINNKIEHFEDFNILEVSNYRSYKSIKIDTDIKTLYELLLAQNFVPVVDDKEIFIGIITRKAILDYVKKYLKNEYNNLKISLTIK